MVPLLRVSSVLQRQEVIPMAVKGRKIRKDITVGGLEKKLGMKLGTIRNPSGKKARSDKKLETIQKEKKKS